ncbi:MAG: dihydroorotase [Desulfomonilia bacterium]|jgi:dihydroorotase|uniref:Dihydroorotase n=1 Tax=anaerobic digester metagenome TaxID=1263854 RepID=A0A485M113_9ZZZZ|nr:dihydroorotase [Pseudomonadota bacterium]NLA14906.1 dihydroorotase [Tissierellia bacterium]HPD20202.1 dihydroorotase [Deltaproteobacteria bacterium]HRS57214.1 dihydroorotase [Desulfomonilia bacterium]HRV34920.1 dihydroorotase [Desulfomonilia bacterium]
MWIKGGTIIDPANGIEQAGDIHIREGLIADVCLNGSRETDEEVIDAAGLWVLPGLIDMHVHLREPGFEYKEDITSGSRAAAAGGITTVVCMPNTNPVNDNPSVTRYIVEKARHKALIRVLPAGAITRGLQGTELSEMGLMKAAGIVAVTDDGKTVADAGIMRRGMEYAATFELPVISHCQDKSLGASGVMNEGSLSSRLGLAGIPSLAEDVVISRDTLLARYTGLPIHITHVSTSSGLEIIRQAKDSGVRVSCDVTPHHLLLTEERVRGYDTNAKMYPPLRREEDRLALIEGIRSGIVDCIATDHAPHARDEKDLDFDLAPFGVIGLQTLLPAIYRLHREYDISFSRLLTCVTINPARILGIEGGSLSPGVRADITLFDPAASWVFTRESVLSKSENSPFLGSEMHGRVVLTIVEGRIVHRI